MCLRLKHYELSFEYIHFLNYIKGPNIHCQNMSFFKNNDTQKTLLLYDGGGLGDKIMLSRFIPQLCTTYNKNTIVFLCADRLVWLFQEIYTNIPNLLLVPQSHTHLLPMFDYHCSLLSLLKHLNITYNNIYQDTTISKINVTMTSQVQNIVSSFNKPTFVLNWKGNPNNSHEKYNRQMCLTHAIPLFQMKHVQWVVLDKSLSTQEKHILQKYKVPYYGQVIDTDKAFYDTISILRHVDGIVSTDTSLPHLSLSLGVKTYVLLTTGCEWRWTRDKTTQWYPDAIVLRQAKFGDWNSVVCQLKTMLTQ